MATAAGFDCGCLMPMGSGRPSDSKWAETELRPPIGIAHDKSEDRTEFGFRRASIWAWDTTRLAVVSKR